MAVELDREEEWCLDALASLIELAGFETFVSAPLIDASPRWFPDRGDAGAAETATLAGRLLAHAGLGEARLRLVDYSPTHAATTVDFPDFLLGPHHREAIELEAHVLGRREDQVGVLAHLLGLAWWETLRDAGAASGPFRGAADDDQLGGDRDAARGSLAALYLGFGVPATNVSQRALHGGHSVGTVHTSEWMIASSGGLSSKAMCFVVAVQLVVRGRRGERDAVLRELGANHRHDVKNVLERLGTERDPLRSRLRLPPASQWPEVDASRPELDPGCIELVEAVDPGSLRAFNRGQPVFRVRHRRTASFAFLGALPGLAAFAVGPSAGLAGVAIGAGLGATVGRRRLYFKCSDPGCERLLTRSEGECSGCKGHIAGDIGHARERLEALEALELADDTTAAD